MEDILLNGESLRNTNCDTEGLPVLFYFLKRIFLFLFFVLLGAGAGTGVGMNVGMGIGRMYSDCRIDSHCCCKKKMKKNYCFGARTVYFFFLKTWLY